MNGRHAAPSAEASGLGVVPTLTDRALLLARAPAAPEPLACCISGGAEALVCTLPGGVALSPPPRPISHGPATRRELPWPYFWARSGSV